MTAVTVPQRRWLLSGQNALIAGHVYGRKQPSWLVGLQLAPEAEGVIHSTDLTNRLKLLLPLFEACTGQRITAQVQADRPVSWRSVVEAMGACAWAAMKGAGMAVVDPVECTDLAKQAEASVQPTRLLLPAVPGRAAATLETWRLVFQMFQYMADPSLGSGELSKSMSAGFMKLKGMAPRTTNTPRLMLAAYDLGIPVLALGEDVYQYGEGCHAQWFNSTITLHSSGIGIKFAKNKMATANRLRQAGLPASEHQVVANAEEAVGLAKAWGSTVVVKPADKDGGQGVSAGLETEAEISAAFAKARAVSRHVLLEKHFHGRDHRLTVLDGQLLWAVERVPASVVGNGQHTVQQLVVSENARPERGEGPQAVLKRLMLDDEALAMLRKHGLTPDSVPGEGARVTLRRIANVSTGGEPVAVNGQVHPDNARLALLAAQALRLDLAGVDLLIPDISVSWRSSGALICEVNAQPQIGAFTGPHLYGEILRRRLKGNGRVPVVVVMGDAPGAPLTRRLVEVLVASGRRVGWMDGQGIRLNDQWLPSQPGLMAQGQTLRTHPAVEAMVLQVQTDQPLRTGLPVDQINWLVMAGQGKPSQRTAPDWQQLLKMSLPTCCGVVAQLEASAAGAEMNQIQVDAPCQVKIFTEAALLASFSGWVTALGVDNRPIPTQH